MLHRHAARPATRADTSSHDSNSPDPTTPCLRRRDQTNVKSSGTRSSPVVPKFKLLCGHKEVIMRIGPSIGLASSVIEGHEPRFDYKVRQREGEGFFF